MKKLIFLSLCLVLAGCTKMELKKKALKEAELQYKATLREEIKDITMPGRLADNYLSYLQNTAEYEVVDIKMPTETTAVVSVNISAVPPENRHTLVKIAVGLDNQKAANFNMGNAINLIEQQPGQVRGKKQNLYFLKFHKGASDWILDP